MSVLDGAALLAVDGYDGVTLDAECVAEFIESRVVLFTITLNCFRVCIAQKLQSAKNLNLHFD